jgi:Transglycosylase SLT domain
VLLVAAAVAGEPISLAASATQVAGGIGGGLRGMTDPSEVGASGRLNEDDKIGDYLLENADDVDSLLKLGNEAPSDDELGIPGTMLDAYMQAADQMAVAQPGCNLDWALIASIGRIESNHARNGRLDDEGNTTPNILGPVLNGGGFAAIRDTDGGALDGDNRWDRAVGAMQFIPSTWQGYAADGNEDGVKSPHNVYDATLAAGKYLCSGGMDMLKPQDRAAAVFRYNHSDSYVATVLLWADAYAGGYTPIPDYDDYDVSPDVEALGPPSYPDLPPPVVTPPPSGGGNTPPPGNTPTTGTSPDGGPTSSVTPTPNPTSASETTVPCFPTPSTSTTTPTTTDTTTTPPSETTSTTTSSTDSATSPSSSTPTTSC